MKDKKPKTPSRGRYALKNHPMREEMEADIRGGATARAFMAKYSPHVKRTAYLQTLMRMVKREMREEYITELEERVEKHIAPKEAPGAPEPYDPAPRRYGGIDVLEEMDAIKRNVLRIAHKAEESGNLNTAISAIKAQQDGIKLMIQLADQMRRSGDFNPWAHPDVIAYQEGLMSIIEKHPEVMREVEEYIARFSSRTT